MQQKKKSRKRFWWILILLLLAITAFYILWSGRKKETMVAVDTVTLRTIIESVEASGKIYPEVEVKISPDISGQITELYVEEGDSVKKGQLLARIDADMYDLQRKQAASQVMQSEANAANIEAGLPALQLQVEQAKDNLERNRQLYQQKAISKVELEQFENAFKQAESGLAAAKANLRSLKAGVQATQTNLSRAYKDLSRTNIAAPMNGVVSSLNVKKGESVAGNSFNVGTEMMTVAELAEMEVRVEVVENDIVKVKIGDSAVIEIDAYSSRKFRGVVTKIASSVKSGVASLGSNNTDVTNYEVKIRIDKTSYADLIAPGGMVFRPGMNANASIKTKRKADVVAAPVAAVTTRLHDTTSTTNNKTAANKEMLNELDEVVFVVKPDNTVEKRIVKTGIQDINYFEIISGLKSGEKVVTAPNETINSRLDNGAKVKVVPKDKLFAG